MNEKINSKESSQEWNKLTGRSPPHTKEQNYQEGVHPKKMNKTDNEQIITGRSPQGMNNNNKKESTRNEQ